MKAPKGTLLIIGGSEDKDENKMLDMAQDNVNFKPFEILEHLLPEKKNTCIELITTATTIPDEIGEIYTKSFQALGYNKMNVMNIETREKASDPELLERIDNAHAVFFSGGNQFRLSTILGATELVGKITERYYNDETFIVAGTSAGAMAMPKLMILEGQPKEDLLKNDIKTGSGLGFFDGCIIDTHFGKRGRFGRLAYSIITNPACVGIGIGEDTALIVKKANIMECIGSGMIIIIDGSKVRSTNIIDAEDNEPVHVENLKVHILSKGNIFLLQERRVIPEPKK